MQIVGRRSAVAPEQWASLYEFRREVVGRGGAAVATHLRIRGIEVVVIGGSAITSHVPDVYTSMDIDFAVTSGIDRRRIARALNELGFRKRGRVFVHPETVYALDFVAERPYIDQEPVYDFAEIHTPVGSVRVLHLEDAIADRIAAGSRRHRLRHARHQDGSESTGGRQQWHGDDPLSAHPQFTNMIGLGGFSIFEFCADLINALYP